MSVRTTQGACQISVFLYLRASCPNLRENMNMNMNYEVDFLFLAVELQSKSLKPCHIVLLVPTLLRGNEG